MKLSVLNIKGEETGREINLDKKIFGVDPNEHVVYLDVKQRLANGRQGTHKTKGRSEIAGSTRKLKKQKGTGTARAGSIKSPVFRGGGTMFGPQPRDYGMKVNKKVRNLATKSALSAKAKGKQIIVLEDFELNAPKTKEFVSILANLKVGDKKSLFITGEYNKNILLSSRNLQNTKVSTAEELSTYEILHADELILLEGSLEKIQKRLN